MPDGREIIREGYFLREKLKFLTLHHAGSSGLDGQYPLLFYAHFYFCKSKRNLRETRYFAAAQSFGAITFFAIGRSRTSDTRICPALLVNEAGALVVRFCRSSAASLGETRTSDGDDRIQ